jgi:hypothetical protein
VSIELASTSLVVPTVSTKADSTVVFTSETGRRTRATAGESIELEAGRYTMDVRVDGRDTATIGAYAAPLNDVTIQRHVDRDGNTGAITMGLNPDLVNSEIIEEMIGGPVVSATIILTDARFRLLVAGTYESIMLEYTPETGEGRIGFGEPTYGGEGIDRRSPDDLISAHGLDPREFDVLFPEEIFTVDTDALGAEIAAETLLMIEAMLAMGEYLDLLGRVSGWMGELAGTIAGGALAGLAGASAGPAGAGALGAAGGMVGGKLGSALEDWGRADNDEDGVPNWRDLWPNNPNKGITAESEGGVLMLSDSPAVDIGDADRTFDIQVDFILDDLDALEDFGAMVGGSY